VRPAVNVGISVSRVGGNAQTKAMRKVAGRLRLDLAQYRELEAFAQFGSDLDATTLRQLARGERTVEILKQPQYQPMAVESQVAVIYAVTNGYLDQVPVERVRAWERGFLEYLSSRAPQVSAAIKTEGAISEDLERKLIEAIKAFTETFNAEIAAAAKAAAPAAAPAAPAAKPAAAKH
jgi:F-type H+-transporting ATPase subunit alpha